MAYPNGVVATFVDNLHNISKNLEKSGLFRKSDGFCKEDINKILALDITAEEKMNLSNGIFWVIWVEQIMKRVCDLKTYREFKQIFKYPSYFEGESCENINNPQLVISGRLSSTPDLNLLKAGKDAFWGDVKAWLKYEGNNELVDKAEKAFKKDLNIRFDNKYWELF